MFPFCLKEYNTITIKLWLSLIFSWGKVTIWSMAQVTYITLLSNWNLRFIRFQVYNLQSTLTKLSVPHSFLEKYLHLSLWMSKCYTTVCLKKKKKKDAHSYCEVIRKILLQINYIKIKYTSKVCGLFFVCFTIFYKVQRNPKGKTTPYNIV